MATQQEQKDVASAGATGLAQVDDFAALLKQNFKPRSERAASEVENAVQTLVTQALADSSLVKGDVIDTIEEMIARLDEKLSAQMNEILHAPEFQKLESAWRGLHYLVFNSETDATLKIRVMNVGKTELYRNLSSFRAPVGIKVRCSKKSTNRNSVSSAASRTVAWSPTIISANRRPMSRCCATFRRSPRRRSRRCSPALIRICWGWIAGLSSAIPGTSAN